MPAVNPLWQTEEEWKQYGLQHNYDERNPKSLVKSKVKEERSWYNKGSYKKWVKNFSFTREKEKYLWKTEEEWKQYGLEERYNERNPYSFRKSEDKEERSWYAKGSGKKWAKNFPFSREKERYHWDTEEQWREYGLQHNYDERSPYSFQKSKDKEERSWYNKGNLKKWDNNFPFTREREKYLWETEEQWKQYGLEKRYDERNPKSLVKSKDKEERSWYRKGNSKKWAKNFPFTREREFIATSWQTEEEWREYGFERLYNERNPKSLIDSKDKEERSWYAKGNLKKWAKDFPFTREIEKYRWQTEEEWKQYGLEKRYNERNPRSLQKSKDKEERSWYGRGNSKKWAKDFPFQRKIVHSPSATKQQLEAILDEYIEGGVE